MAQPSGGQIGAKASGAPPHPYENRWYVHIDGETYGPYSGHQIRQMVGQNQIADSDFVYSENGSAWVQIANDPILGTLFKSSEPQRPLLMTRERAFALAGLDPISLIHGRPSKAEE